MLDTDVDAGVFHVVNLQPFHTWDSLSSSRRTISVAAGQTDPETLISDVHITQTNNQYLPAADMCYDMPCGTDPVLILDCDSGDDSPMVVFDPNPSRTG